MVWKTVNKPMSVTTIPPISDNAGWDDHLQYGGEQLSSLQSVSILATVMILYRLVELLDETRP